jgi:HEAT repeat protein
MEDQRPVPPTGTSREVMDYHLNNRLASSRIPRNILIGVGITFMLTFIEVALWIFNPFHVFGSGASHSLSALLAIPTHTPLLLLIPLVQVVAACILVQIIDKPLALRRYVRDMQKELEQYRTLYTPLTSWPAIYETPITHYQESPDLSIPSRVRSTSMLELAQELGATLAATQSHQLILGDPGAGKTILLYLYQFTTLQQSRLLILGRNRIPLYIPLRNYSLYLETHNAGLPQEKAIEGTQSLLDFLYTSDLVGMHHLRPFLPKLKTQGRILFLCDGLDEVDHQFRAAVALELAELMGQNQNQLVLTCRGVDYQEQPQLVQAAEGNLVAHMNISPLDAKQVRSFVERFIKDQDSKKSWRHTAGQVMEVINSSRLRDHCTNPLMFFSLMEIIDDIGVNRGKQLDTRGRLLRAFVKHLIQHEISRPQWSNSAPTEEEVLLFLGEVACAARWTNAGTAIQLPVRGRNRGLRPEDLAAALKAWLSEHSPQSLGALNAVGARFIVATDLSRPQPIPRPTVGPQFITPSEELSRLIQFARSAALIEISPAGILSFRHELFAAYFIAEYFVAQAVAAGKQAVGDDAEDVMNHPPSESFRHWEVETRFIAPVALWAGLLDDPVEHAKRFAALGKAIPAFNLEALALGLVCMGVACNPPQSGNVQQIQLPSDLEEAIAMVVQDEQACNILARLFTRYAEEGAQEIYQSLFTLLAIDGIEEFMTRLNTGIVLDLLFKQLCDVVDNTNYETMVKRLVRVLGHFGDAAVPRAAELSQSSPGRSGRLRSAAINILGGTGEQRAVEPLMLCLRDSIQAIVGRAANALVRLGPEHTFTRLIYELEDHTATSTSQQVQWTILHILERFLSESQPVHHLTPSQHAPLVNALFQVLTSNYAPESQQKAREMLVRLAGTTEVSVAGEKAIEILVQNLSSDDDAVARAAIRTLKEIGTTATPHLLGQLKQQAPEIMRVRIVEVLGALRDPHALPYLLRFLDDPALVVQQQVAVALHAFTPESIPGLIERVLHSDSELVATRAEQILSDIGDEVTTPVIQALSPVVPGRTQLLVHVLERIRNPRAIPALIALLEPPLASSKSPQDSSLQPHQGDQTLQLAVVHALGQFPDQRVVAPLLDMLASSNPLIYEGAINALSYLEDVALDALIAALDGEIEGGSPAEPLGGDGKREVEQKAILTSRIERALLGMPHFPGDRLLEVLGQGSDAQVQHIINIFLMKGAEAAQVLVGNLFHPDRRRQSYVRNILGQMSGQVVVPALLEELHHPEPAWRAVIAEYLLKHPREAIPPLVGFLDDNERGDAAEIILLEFGPVVLPYLVPGLDALNNQAQERSRRIILTLVQQTPELVYEAVQLFNLSPPQRAYETLMHLLTNELVDLSVPVLLEGLEDAHLVGAVSEALVSIVNKDDARGETVLTDLLAALRMEQRRHGAEITLVEIGARAVSGVGNLITDPDRSVAQAAQNILCEMGVPAFSFIWAAYSDISNHARRAAARSIFRRMRTVVIKDELVQLLQSNEPDNISMALALLLERIHDEALQSNTEHEMIPALLEHVQTHSDEKASLRIIALLLLLGGPTVIEHITQVLYDYPNHQRLLIYAFLLLGEEGEEMLLEILHDPDASTMLRAEAASLLGILAPNVDIREYARMLGEYGLWAGRSVGQTGVLQPDRLAVSLRALGGLLAGGHWNTAELQNLRLRSKERSAERELYDILLGWRYSPRITVLENELQTEQEEHRKNILRFSQEILNVRTQVADLEKELEGLRYEHGMRSEELEEANKKIEDLQRSLSLTIQEKQSIQDDLQRTVQERQAVRNNLQQIIRERDSLQEQVDEWRHYAEQLEQGLHRPQSPKRR